MSIPDVFAYREGSRVTVEVSGIIDLADCDATSRALRLHAETCELPELVVRLHDSIITTSALRAVAAAYTAARDREVTLRVVVPPVAVRVFEAADLEFLLDPEVYGGR